MQLVKIKLKTVTELISLKQRQWYLQLSPNKVYLPHESLITTRKLLSEAIQLLVVLLNQNKLKSQNYPQKRYQREARNSIYDLPRQAQEIKILLSALESIRARIVIQNNITLFNLREIKDEILKLIGYSEIDSFDRRKSNSFTGLNTPYQTLSERKKPSIIDQDDNKRKLKMQLERQMINYLSNKHNEVKKDKSFQKQTQAASTRAEQHGTIKKRKQKRFNYLQECQRQMHEQQFIRTPQNNKIRQSPSTNYSSSEKDPLGDELFDFVPAPFGPESKLDFEKLMVDDSLQQPQEIINEDSLQLMKKEEEQRHQKTGYFGQKLLEQEEKQNFSFSINL